MKSKTTLSGLAAVAAASLVLTACSSDSSDSSDTNDTTAPSSGGGSDASHRGGTFTMLWSSAGVSIDPATDYDRNWFILRSTHDGLMAWKQVGGSEGNDLVPDLATDIPTPTDNEKTWTFTLRDGIKFSDGSVLKASDIAYSLTRQFKIPGPGVGLYAAIKGADTCISSPADCDLSQGVVTDDKAGTVTFHLTEPDADFLQKLALPFAYAVPAGTPNEEAGTTPIPGTGPYVITDYSAGKSMSLARNEEFKEWSADAQPDGYPDKIELRLGLTDSDATTEVENGTADWVYETPPPDRLGEVADNYPDQIHITPTVIQYGMTLNTRVPPFDNPDVRQALNFATDRSAAIGLFGGERLATPSCQILPPNFPGYQPYCPYTVDPGETWTAPDMETAQELVDGSGTKGQKVAVITTPDEASKAMSLYFVSLLNDLGYDASLKTLNASVAYSYVQDSRNKAQMYYSYWAPDYTAASNFLNIQVGCGGFHEASTASPNLSEFCDPQIDAMTQAAMDLQVSDPDAANEKWAEIDKLVTDAAPLVQLFTSNKLDFVSKRVGNYQYSPSVTGNFLFTQAWVQ